jgi:hypothetical protein
VGDYESQRVPSGQCDFPGLRLLETRIGDLAPLEVAGVPFGITRIHQPHSLNQISASNCRFSSIPIMQEPVSGCLRGAAGGRRPVEG